MHVDYQILTIREARKMIYGLFLVIGRPLRFSFDLRKRATLHEREEKEWYCVTYVDADEKHIAVFTSMRNDDNVEAYVTHGREDFDQRFIEYCYKHNPKFDGRICVNVGDWEEKEQRFYEDD